jgi:hypothetical protein
MKRLLLILGVLPLLGAANSITTQSYTSGASGLSISNANTAIIFTDNRNGGTNALFCATSVTVINRTGSAATILVNWDQTVASGTLDIPIVAGASITRTRPVNQCMSGMGIITASSTATADVLAQP